MAYLLIQGDGGKYLPFARGALVRLRALGLYAASQHFDVSGYQIHVEISGEHETIRIKGGGGWLAFGLNTILDTSSVHDKPVIDEPDGPFPPRPPEPEIPPQPTPIPAPDYPPSLDLPHSGRWAIAVVESNLGYANPMRLTFTYYQGNQTFVDVVRDWSATGEGNSGTPQNPIPFTGYSDETIGSVTQRYEPLRDMNEQNILLAARLAEIKAIDDAYFAATVAQAQAYAAQMQIYTNAVRYYNTVTLPEWEYAMAHPEVGFTYPIVPPRVAFRPVQLARLVAELEAGAATPFVAFAALPPINPRVVPAVANPVQITDASSDGSTDTFDYELTDRGQDPEAVDTSTGVLANTAMASNVCGVSYNRSVLTNLWVSPEGMRRGLEVDGNWEIARLAKRAYLANPTSMFGSFATGFLEPFKSGVKAELEFEVPDAYAAFLSAPMERSTDEAATIESDAYMPPGTTLVLVLLEYEAFDRYTNEWLWVPTPELLTIDPVHICHIGTPYVLPPLFDADGVTPRAVRLRKIIKQSRSKDWTWSAAAALELDPAPEFERDLTQQAEQLTSATFPPAIAILQRLPSATIPPRRDGPLADAAIYRARLGEDVELRDVLQTEWAGDPTAEGWLDRLVMEALNLTNIYRSATE